jgi:hypothetical protein
MDTLDEQVIRAITTSFGKAIWRRTLVVLTHAQLSPPDGLDYNDFLKRRSDSLLRYIRSGAGIGKRESAVMCIFTCYIIIPIILYAISACHQLVALCVEHPLPKLHGFCSFSFENSHLEILAINSFVDIIWCSLLWSLGMNSKMDTRYYMKSVFFTLFGFNRDFFCITNFTLYLHYETEPGL